MAQLGPDLLPVLPFVWQAWLGRTTYWSPKSQCVYGPENEIAAVTFLPKTSAALTNSSAFASTTDQDPGERLLIEGLQPRLEQKSMLPIFAKAPCCLELFGCCCRRLSQHGVGEVLIPLRHCWPDAFFLRLPWQWIVL